MTVTLFVHQFVILFVTFLPFLLSFSLETDTISPGSLIKDPDSIISRNQRFKLGFFTPPKTTNRYLGVLFKGIVIWVANRNEPLNDSSSILTISKDGNLVLVNERNQTVWSTNYTTTTSPINTTLQILDTGNLLLRDTATGTTIWESFSHPTPPQQPDFAENWNVFATGSTQPANKLGGSINYLTLTELEGR